VSNSLVHIFTGHVISEHVQLILDHCDSNSGSFLDSSVESSILGSWQHMEVTLFMIITVITVIELRTFFQLQHELAIFDICVLFHENRVHFLPSLIVSFNPSFRVVAIEIFAEDQLEVFSSGYIVTIDLNVIDFSVVWRFGVIPSSSCFIIINCTDRHDEIHFSIQAIDSFFVSDRIAVDFIIEVTWSPLNLESVIVIGISSEVLNMLPFFLELFFAHLCHDRVFKGRNNSDSVPIIENISPFEIFDIFEIKKVEGGACAQSVRSLHSCDEPTVLESILRVKFSSYIRLVHGIGSDGEHKRCCKVFHHLCVSFVCVVVFYY